MSDQYIYIIEFPSLYNILFEVKNLFNFKIKNFESSQDFIKAKESLKLNNSNFIIIVNKEIQKLSIDEKIPNSFDDDIYFNVKRMLNQKVS